MIRIARTAAASQSIFTLGAWGNSTSDCGPSGGGIGAGTGALTDRKQIDLGEPIEQ